MTETKNIEVIEADSIPQQLPTSYVLWLTMRSRFIDEIAKTNAEILIQWKEFENQEMQRIQTEMEVPNERP